MTSLPDRRSTSWQQIRDTQLDVPELLRLQYVTEALMNSGQCLDLFVFRPHWNETASSLLS